MNYDVDNIMKLSQVAVKSKLFPNLTVEAIAMIGIVAQDLNLPLSTALMGGINIIQGKPSLSARVMNLLIRRSGHSITVRNEPEGCFIKGIRKDTGDIAEVSFTLEDAKAANLLTKDNWKKHLPDMLFSRALSRIARQLFPDCIEGAYIEGEIEEKDGIIPLQSQGNSSAIDVPPPVEEPLITEEQLQIIQAKVSLIPKATIEKILKAKRWESFAEMKQKQYNDCLKFLEEEIKKEVDKELSDKAPWEDQ